MKITDVKSYVYGNPWKNWIFFKIETDEGLYGIGEATGGLSTKHIVGGLEEQKRIVIGMNPLDLNGVMEALKFRLFLQEGGNIISGINIALWDLLGRAYGKPLYALLGGKCRPSIRAYANGWYQGPRDPVFFGERAAQVKEMGYTALKFDPFGSAYKYMDAADERLSIEIVRAVRQAVGEDVDICIEAHDRFSVSQAVRLGYMLEEFRPMWYETPVFSTDIEATVEVARRVPVTVASGERSHSPSEIAALAQSRAVDILQPETLGIGGVSAMIAACNIAAAYGASVAPHNAQSPFTTAVNAHLDVAISNIIIQECFDDFHVDWKDDVISGYPRVENGYITPSEKPGIGVEINESAVDMYPYGSDNFLRLFESGWEKRRMS